jgi:hypothetical protein
VNAWLAGGALVVAVMVLELPLVPAAFTARTPVVVRGRGRQPGHRLDHPLELFPRIEVPVKATENKGIENGETILEVDNLEKSMARR